MGSTEYTVEEQRKTLKTPRPHVVILGAGASLAAFPNGDKNGTKLPLMKNLIDVTGMGPLLDRRGIIYKNRDFEAVFAELFDDPDKHDLLGQVEAHIHPYFSGLRLPNHPTMYDHLVLSLREKDLIATFNWDPFLPLAIERNLRFTQPPQTAYLHGNVAVGFCIEDRVMGLPGGVSRKSGKLLEPSRLLYPITTKDYNTDQFIKIQWDMLRAFLKGAYVLTVFGYGAPASDVEAIRIMKEAWGLVQERNMEQIEIIDLKSRDELRDTWSPFIHTDHYEVQSDFFNSMLARSPRRSCDVMWASLMEDLSFQHHNPLPQGADFDELYSFLRPLVRGERRARGLGMRSHRGDKPQK